MTREVTLTYTEVRNWLKAQPFNRTFDMTAVGRCLLAQFAAERHPESSPRAGITYVWGDGFRYTFDERLSDFISAEYSRPDAKSVTVCALLFRMKEVPASWVAEFFRRMWRTGYANAG